MAGKKQARGKDTGLRASLGKKVEKRKIADLKPHPKQAEHFRDLPDAKLQRLAKGMLIRGLKNPVEITRDNVIICGHQRVRAALLNGWTEIVVVTRDDLLDEAAIEAELLRDNRERRQLSRLQEVRCLKGEWELAQTLPCGERPDHLQGTLKEDVSAELGMSSKNTQRYLDLLKTPPAVQDAFDDGELPLNTAARVAGLPEDEQDEIAKEILAGKDPKNPKAPKEVAEHYLANTRDNRQRIGTALRMTLGHFFKAIRTIRGRADEVEDRHLTEHSLVLLNDVQSVISQLLQVKAGGEPSAANPKNGLAPATCSTPNAAVGRETTKAG